MTSIRSWRCGSVAAPLGVATAFSSRIVTERHYGLIEVEGADDICGIGVYYVGSAGGQGERRPCRPSTII
jgi:hypothetical protein